VLRLRGVFLCLAVPAALPGEVEAIVLGVAQDGGVPHAGCQQKLCVEARRDPRQRRRVASLGLIDSVSGKRFLIDATPDFGELVESLGAIPDGILLTHAHIGHYLGLAQLGREVLGARAIPVYCTKSMAGFLRENRPWSRLVERDNVILHEIEPGRELALTPRLRVEAVRVPHRDEDSDTVGYFVRGPERTLLWLPDIDKWEKWDRSIAEVLQDRRLTAFLDGTFFDAGEIPGRSIADIPHPLGPETVARVGTRPPARTVFVHLNHTNRLLWDAGAVRALEQKGYAVAREGERVGLGIASIPRR
jgi:pyrroloquinoline quinone biosynthesis protein B